jgi:hypothetical protein
MLPTVELMTDDMSGLRKIHRIGTGIVISVEGKWIQTIALKRIHRPEPVCTRFQVTSTEDVHAEVGVELFAGEQVIVGRAARFDG